MKKGLLWYDDNPALTLADKVSRAARRYRKKFGATPDVCYVHPSALSGDDKVDKAGDVRIALRPTVLIHHFWIGQDDRAKVTVQQ